MATDERKTTTKKIQWDPNTYTITTIKAVTATDDRDEKLVKRRPGDLELHYAGRGRSSVRLAKTS